MVVPNKFPFKEDILEQAKQQKDNVTIIKQNEPLPCTKSFKKIQELAEKIRIKEERKKVKAENKLKGVEENLKGPLKQSLDEIVKAAQRKQDQFNSKMDLIAKASNPFDEMNRKLNPADKEQSLKSFYKEFKKVVEAADVLIEVLDARDPVGSRCPQVEEMIINSGKNKKLVLLLNKIGKSIERF